MKMNILAAEFTRTLDIRSPGEAERVRVVTRTKKGHHFLPRCMKCRRGLAMRILSVCQSVRPSVRLSVTRVDCDKMEERSVQIFIPYERTIILVF